MDVKTFYKSSVWRMIAEGMIAPYIPVLALSLGATKTLIGLISAVPTALGLLSQMFWASVNDIVKNKSWLIVVGGIIWAVFWIPIAYATNPIMLLVFLSIQSMLSSIAIPAWTLLFIQFTPSYKRGETTAFLNTYSGIGTLIGNVAAGLVLNKYGFTYFFFFMIFFIGVISRLNFLKSKDRSIKSSMTLKESLKNSFNFKGFTKNKRMLNLIKAISFFQFSVAIAGPFFSIAIIQKYGGTNLDIGLLSAIGVASAILFYRSWGWIIDRVGKKTVMTSCMIPISLIPLIYVVTNDIRWIYIYTIVGQMSWAGFDSATFAYFSDVLPKENRSSMVSAYNLLTGMSQAVAPFVGGLLVDSLNNISFVFIASFLLRIFSMNLFEKLEERVGTKGGGYGFIPWGISYRIEMFFNTYSMAIDGVRKEGKKVIDIGRVRKIISKYRT